MADDFDCLCEDRTLIVYDLRNRGWSDQVSDLSKLAAGTHNDVNDLETVRRHFGISRVDVIGHSYLGLMVILYAMKHPEFVNRVVQIGPMQPHAGRQYPAHLMCADATLTEVFSKLGELQQERGSTDPVEFCKKFWDILRVIYVSNPADAGRINWGRCELANERNFMKYWSESILPSMKELDFNELSNAQAPVLTIHGMKDRSAPYGGGREWAMMLPNARLLSVENAGHAPWVEAEELVFGAIEQFLGGTWPEGARKVMSMDL
jgi:proline iminopeptidase